jgi:hypothetical protein
MQVTSVRKDLYLSRGFKARYQARIQGMPGQSDTYDRPIVAEFMLPADPATSLLHPAYSLRGIHPLLGDMFYPEFGVGSDDWQWRIEHIHIYSQPSELAFEEAWTWAMSYVETFILFLLEVENKTGRAISIKDVENGWPGTLDLP